MGAWIEISKASCDTKYTLVAPLVGAWIEITTYFHIYIAYKVAPLVGAWIEIENFAFISENTCRSPCGSVD